jgi:uridine kinase
VLVALNHERLLDVSALIVISGPPGSGKTTVARMLAANNPRGVHIPSDVFYTFPTQPVPPYRAQAHGQNATVTNVKGV